MSEETTIPCLPCTNIKTVFDFYQILGFEVTYQQKSPYEYGVLHRGGYDLHFFGLKGLKAEEAFSTCIVVVPEVENLHQVYSEALRKAFGKFPVAGFPRLTRMKKGQGRFTLVDPCGNSVIYVKRTAHEKESKPDDLAGLPRALEMTRRLRDESGDDAKAAKILDAALNRHTDASPLERARALAARIELAVALGDSAVATRFRGELATIELSAAERETYRHELEAADALEGQL